jgi:hypothetical protein
MTKHTPQAMREMAEKLHFGEFKDWGFIYPTDQASAMLRDLANEAEAAQAIAAGDATFHNAIDYWQDRALKAEAAQVSVPEGWTSRHSKVQRFALRRFIHDALGMANAAAQDKAGRWFKKDDVHKLIADAKTAEECLQMLADDPSTTALSEKP